MTVRFELCSALQLHTPHISHKNNILSTKIMPIAMPMHSDPDAVNKAIHEQLDALEATRTVPVTPNIVAEVVSKRFINDPTDVVEETIQGIVLSDPNVRRIEGHTVIPHLRRPHSHFIPTPPPQIVDRYIGNDYDDSEVFPPPRFSFDLISMRSRRRRWLF